MPEDGQREARVLRATRRSWLWRGWRRIAARVGQNEHDELRAARRGNRQVPGSPVEAQRGEEYFHLLCEQLSAIRAAYRQRRCHAERGVDQGRDGQSLDRRRKHLG